jgi:hypothetical protein
MSRAARSLRVTCLRSLSYVICGLPSTMQRQTSWWTGKRVGRKPRCFSCRYCNRFWVEGAAEWCHVRFIQCSLCARQFETLVTVSIACCAEINRHAAWSRHALPSVNWCSQLSVAFSTCNCSSVATRWSSVCSGVCKTAKSDYWLRHVCPHEKNSASNEQMFMKFDISVFTKICQESSSLTTNIWQEQDSMYNVALRRVHAIVAVEKQWVLRSLSVCL